MMLKAIHSIVFLLLVSPIFAQYHKLENQYFPEEDRNIQTPSFQEGNKFMSYEDLITFLERAAAISENITLGTIGKTQKGRAIPVIQFNNSRSSYPLKVLYIGAIHGDEPASAEGLCLLIDSLTHGLSISDNIELSIVPMLNIDGYLKQDRQSHNELDINRDFTKYRTPEARALLQFASEFDPHVVVDFHEFSPYRLDMYDLQDQGVANRYDAMFLYSGNMNIESEIFDISENLLVPEAKKVLENNQRVTHNYFKTTRRNGRIELDLGGNSPRSSTNAFALGNSVSMLLEVRGAGLGKKTLKRRTYTTYLVAQSVLSTCGVHAQQIMNAVQTAKSRTVASSDSVVVKRAAEDLNQVVRFLDLRTNDQVLLSMSVNNSLNPRATLSRERPSYYAITDNTEEVKSILDILGVTYQQMQTEETREVEHYLIKDLYRSNTKTEKVKEVQLKVVTQTTTLALPANTLIVALSQPKGNLIAELFEPDATSSLVRYDIIKIVDHQIPVYRIMP